MTRLELLVGCVGIGALGLFLGWLAIGGI